jgi:hypothetical protein
MSETVQRTNEQERGETLVEVRNLKTYYDEGTSSMATPSRPSTTSPSTSGAARR